MEEVMWAGQVCADGGGDVGRSGLFGWRRADYLRRHRK